MNNILITEAGDNGQNVMAFTEQTAEEVQALLDFEKHQYGEVYAVPDNEVGLYIFEPMWVKNPRKLRAS